MTKNVSFPDRNKYKLEYSGELQDLITQLLKKSPNERIGAENDLADILAHPFFEGLDLVALEKKEIVPKYKPEVTDISKNFPVNKNVKDTFLSEES
jgi:protein-serine/threonine kinase